MNIGPNPTNDPDPDPIYNGLATNFASPGDIARYQALIKAGKSPKYALSKGDNGIGASELGTISTPNSYGVAVPREYLQQHFGNNPASWRTARAQVQYGGQTVQVPFVDLGPGRGPQSQGVIADLTYPLSRALGTGDQANVQLTYVPNAGADYTKNPTDWYNEQAQIHQQLTSPPQVRRASLVAMPAQPIAPAIAQMGGYSQQLGPPRPAQPVAPAIAQMGGYSQQLGPQRPAQPIAPAIAQMGGYGPANQPPPPAPGPASIWYPQQMPVAPPTAPAVAPPVPPFGFRAPPAPSAAV